MFSFLETTKGHFKYLNAQFIVDVHKAQQLLDPNDPKYLFEVNEARFVRNKVCNFTRFMMRQRSLNLPEAEMDNNVTGNTAAGNSMFHAVIIIPVG